LLQNAGMSRKRPAAASAPDADIVSPPIDDPAVLPPPAAAIRAKILDALAKDDIEALRIPIDWNELRPLFAPGAAARDPIDVLKSLSFDGRGREILTIMRAVLAQPFVQIRRGPVTLYEWPAFARAPRRPDDPAQLSTQWACVRFADLARANAEGRPRAMRLAIADDGVWHYFRSED
jgi:hypothetical protein